MKEQAVLRILTVEDDPESGASIRRLLEKKFLASVELAPDVPSARRMLGASRYDIVTMDSNGLDLLEEIGGFDEPPAVIVISGNDEPSVVSRALDLGAMAYIAKGRDMDKRLSGEVRKVAQSTRAGDREQIEFQAHLLDCADSSVVATGSDGTITYWNKFSEKLFGWTAEEAVGKNALDLLGMRRENAAVDQIRSTGNWSGEARLKRKDGKRFAALVHTSPIIQDGKVIGVVGVGSDITELRRQDDALRKMINETNQRREEITALLESTRTVLEGAEFEPAARTVFEVCRNLVGATIGYLALGTVEQKHIELLFTFPEDLIDLMRNRTAMPAIGPALEVLSSRKASFINDFKKSPEMRKVPGRHPSLDNILFAPLMIEGEAQGLVMLANKPGGFDKRDVLMAQAFGEILSLALMNERNLAAVKRSEALYRGVVEDQDELICRMLPDGTITFVNGAYCDYYGKSRGQLIGKSFRPLVPGGEHHEHEEYISLITPDRPVLNREHRSLDLQGSERWLQWTNRGFFDADGNLIELQAVGLDITDRKIEEQELVASEELYRTLLRISPDGITWTDMDGNVMDASDRTLELHGIESIEKLKRINAFDLIAPEERDQAAFYMNRTLDEGFVRDVEYTMLRRDGSQFVGELNASLLRDADGNPAGFMASVRNVTDRKRTEQEMQQLNIELEGYAHAVSHDMRSPLASIHLAVGTLLNLLENLGLGDNTEIVNVAEMIQGNVDKSNKLIEDMLALAEATHFPVEVEEVDIAKVLARVLQDDSVMICERNVVIEASDELGKVVAGETQMYQLFANLIRNAIIHNDSPKPIVRIEHSHDPGTGKHRYKVSDNGPGIPEEEFEKVFTPFYTVAPTGETGLGLSTVDKIVKIHGGEVSVYNSDGACFELTLHDLRPG